MAKKEEPAHADDTPENRTHKNSVAKQGVPPLSLHGRQIEELLLKVMKIEKCCLGDADNLPDESDEFLTLKKEIYTCLFVTKNMIRSRHEILSESGNCVEAIQKASLINKNLETMLQKFVTLKEVFKKQTKQLNQGLTSTELDARFKELQVIKRQIEECKDLVKRGGEYSEEQVKTLTDFLGQMEKAGVAPPTQFDAGEGNQWREPTAQEQATMNRWAARDKEFDQQIWGVGEVVDRLNVLATDIGTKAEVQCQMALEVSRQADEANQEVVEVNMKLKELMTSANGFNFCCKLLLSIVLIAMIGFIAQNLMNRFKKATGLPLKSGLTSFDDEAMAPRNYRLVATPFSRGSAAQHIFENGTLKVVDEASVSKMRGGSNMRLGYSRFARYGTLM